MPRFLDTEVVCAIVLSFHDHAGVTLCRSSRSFSGRIRTHTLILSSAVPSVPPAKGLGLGLTMVDRRLAVPGSGIRREDASVLLLLEDTFSLAEGRIDGAGIRRMAVVGVAKRAYDGPGTSRGVGLSSVPATFNL